MSTLVASTAQGQSPQHQALVERCLQGDRKAQYELYQQYQKAMFNICMRITNDYNEAQDVLQDAFVSAFKHLGTFKGESTFGAWLKRVVVNTAIQHMKKKKLDVVPLADRHNRTPDDAPAETATHWAETQYQVDQVRRAVQKLPDGYRVVLSMYLFDGFDHGEIADILGITESTSKSQFNRAKTKLREILAQTAVL
jgi:RNA polymerase sigma-70 factor (ECF subfamily)